MIARQRGPAPPSGYTPAMPDAPIRTADAEAEAADDVLVEEEVLVEEISIDGMCGVY